MKKKECLFLSLVVYGVLFSSCKPKEIEDSGIVICDSAICQMTHVWKTPLTDVAYPYGNVNYPVIYDNGVLAMAKRNDSMFLRMIDVETGQVRWEKPRENRRNNDLFDCFIDRPYQKDNMLINPYFGASPIRGFENFDLNTGELLWKVDLTDRLIFEFAVDTKGIDSLFFFPGIDRSDVTNTYYPNTVYSGNIYSGTVTKLCEPPLVKDNITDTIIVEAIVPAIINNQTNVLVGYSYKNQCYIGLYNKDTKAWIYSNKKVSGEGFINTNYLDGDKFYIKSVGPAKGRLICGNIEDGSIIWQDSIYSIVYNTVEVNNCIIASDGPFNLAVAALDKYTGKVKWRCDGVYPWMYIQELNGVIYFDNGWLYAIDGYTGKKLWKMEPKDFSRVNDCKVVPGKNGKKGRVVACADRYAFGYEAIR